MSRRYLPLLAMLSTLASGVHAADTRKAEALVVQALSCEVPNGKAKSVVKALGALGAKPGRFEGDFVLPVPVQVFGLPVSYVSALPADLGVDTYIAVFPSGNLAAVAAAARLNATAGIYRREAPRGRLAADLRSRVDVWLSCATQ